MIRKTEIDKTIKMQVKILKELMITVLVIIIILTK